MQPSLRCPYEFSQGKISSEHGSLNQDACLANDIIVSMTKCNRLE